MSVSVGRNSTAQELFLFNTRYSASGTLIFKHLSRIFGYKNSETERCYS
jgi:hypothetical protein